MEATGSACSSCYVNTFLRHRRRRQPKCGSIANEAAIVVCTKFSFRIFRQWHRTHFTWSSSGSRGCVYAVDEGPYYTEKSTFALNGLREKTEVILAAAAPRGCVSGSSVRRARPIARPSRSLLLSTFVSPRQFRLTMHRVPHRASSSTRTSTGLSPSSSSSFCGASGEDKMRLNTLCGRGTTPEKWVARGVEATARVGEATRGRWSECLKWRLCCRQSREERG